MKRVAIFQETGGATPKDFFPGNMDCGRFAGTISDDGYCPNGYIPQKCEIIYS